MSRTERAAAAALGARAEAIVAERLRRQGFAIVAQNARVGRAEIDLIARRGRLYCFVEVRARRHARLVSPLETISPTKVARLRAAAATWMRAHGLRGAAARFDAVSVTFDGEEPAVDYLDNAF